LPLRLLSKLLSRDTRLSTIKVQLPHFTGQTIDDQVIMVMIVIDMIKIVDLFPRRLIPAFLLRKVDMIDVLLLLIRLHHFMLILLLRGTMNPLCLNNDTTILVHLIGRHDHYPLVVLLLVVAVGMMDLLVRIKVHQ
jgi:hypothetical protein